MYYCWSVLVRRQYKTALLDRVKLKELGHDGKIVPILLTMSEV